MSLRAAALFSTPETSTETPMEHCAFSLSFTYRRCSMHDYVDVNPVGDQRIRLLTWTSWLLTYLS